MKLDAETLGAVAWLAIAACFFFVALSFWLGAS